MNHTGMSNPVQEAIDRKTTRACDGHPRKSGKEHLTLAGGQTLAARLDAAELSPDDTLSAEVGHRHLFDRNGPGIGFASPDRVPGGSGSARTFRASRQRQMVPRNAHPRTRYPETTPPMHSVHDRSTTDINSVNGRQPLRRPGRALLTACLLGTLVTACGSDSDTEETGGGAGDVVPNEALLDTVGVWDINANWKGEPADRAVLIVAAPDANGESTVSLHDFDEVDNCYLNPETGVAYYDPFRATVFLDDLVDFDKGTLLRVGNTLQIAFFDTFDIDGDNDKREQQRVDATTLAITETDITPRCSAGN